MAERLTLREALELVRDCSSQKWQQPDGKRMGATDNSGRRMWFITDDVMQAVRETLGVMVDASDADSWYCEVHPERLMGHDGCNGAGIQESCRIHMLLNKLRLAEHETRETAMARDDLAAHLRRQAAAIPLNEGKAGDDGGKASDSPQEFFCNKCGYFGPVEVFHERPNGSGKCDYMAVPMKASESRCKAPPPGWSCSRAPGHEGPCAARPVGVSALDNQTFSASSTGGVESD